jgi:hypothetical protein
MGETPAMTDGDILGPAIAAEKVARAMTLAPNTGAVLRSLADLGPRTLALMHGASFAGDGAPLLRGLADYCEGEAARSAAH